MEKEFFDDEKKKDRNYNDSKTENQRENECSINKKDESKLEKELEQLKKKYKEEKDNNIQYKNEIDLNQLKNENELLKKKMEEESDEKKKIQNEFLNLKNEICFKNTPEENKEEGNEDSKEFSNKKKEYKIIQEKIKNIESFNNSTKRSSIIRQIERRRSIRKKEIEEKEKEDIKKFENEIKDVSKEIYKESIYMIIDDLEESFNDFKSSKCINKIITEKKDKIKEEIIKTFNDFNVNYQINTNNLSDIINYLRQNENLLYSKIMYNKIIHLIDLIEDFKDEIYMNEEKKNLEEVEESYKKIGREGLIEKIKIEKKLQNQINDFIRNPTILIFNFSKLNQSNKCYEKISILGEEYQTGEDELKIELFNLVSYNGFESTVYIELSNNNNININNKKFLIDINLYKENHYEFFLDIREEEKETYSAEIVYISNNIELLPKELKIFGKVLAIKETLLNMKRITLLNISKEELKQYLCSFPYFNQKKKEIIEKNLFSSKHLSTNLFINIIIIDKGGIKRVEADITVFPVVQKIPNEFMQCDINIINLCYDIFFNNSNNFKINIEKIQIQKLIEIIGKNKIERIIKILDEFIKSPFYIIYKEKDPEEKMIETIKKCCILNLLFHKYELIDYELISNKINFFIQKENEYQNIRDSKVKMFAFIDTCKYLLTIEDKKDFDNFSFNLKNMEDLPSDSPFIESETKFREIITNLKDDSKLAFLYLQLNSGAGNDLLSSKTFYQLKMIPLISIKNNILNNFSSYFYIYNISNFKDMALSNPQTNLKGFNEIYLKKGKEDITLHQSNLNTVKLLFLKLYESCHSKFSGNYNFELSPQIAYKTNLSKLSIDKALSIGIIERSLNYKYKAYLYEFPSLNQDNNKELSEDEDYSEIIYHYLEDVGDEIEEKYNEKNEGESGAIMDYYLSNNLFCINGIAMYEGDLNRLLKLDLYIGKSLLSLKRIIERKIKIIYNKGSELINKIAGYKNYSRKYKNIKKGPGEMITHSDVGLLINV